MASPNYDYQTSVPGFNQGLFYYNDIQDSHWNKYFPFQFMIVEAIQDTKTNPPTMKYKPTGWQFTLPIGPQTLDLDMGIASDAKPTLTGITEQHGGAPFRMINFSGTTGIVPMIEFAPTTDKNNATGSTLFGGVVNAAVQTASTAVALATGQPVQYPQVNKPALSGDYSDSNSIYFQSTGFFQFHLLRQFIEAYLAMKEGVAPPKNLYTNPHGFNGTLPYVPIAPKNLRLAFCMWKDDAAYLVTLQRFTMKRSVQNPMEIFYDLSLKAWCRCTIDESAVSAIGDQGRVFASASTLSKALQVVQDTIKLVNAAVATVAAVVADVKSAINFVTSTVQAIVDTLRTVASVIKTINGIAKSIADYPETIQNQLIGPIAAAWSSVRNSWPAISSPAGKKIDQLMQAANNANKGSTSTNTPPPNVNFSSTPGLAAAFQDLLSNVSPNKLQIPTAIAAAIKAEDARIAGLTASDFGVMRDQINNFIDNYTELVGVADPVYAAIYGRPTPAPVKVATQADFDVMYSLGNVAQVLDGLSSYTQATAVSPTPKTIDYIAGLAEQAGIAFTVPTSKFPVPFPYGSSLEQLAAQYLGDVNRWFEIATLNGLQAPWVDEEGFALPLLVNGDGNQVVVSGSNNLFISQTVYLSGNGAARQTMHILGITPVRAGYTILTLDGTTAGFTVDAQAQLEAFLPNTVNSQKSIYIPSDHEPLTEFETKAIPGVNQFDPLINAAGISLMVDQNMDIVLTAAGRSKLAVGLQAIIQKVRIYLSTPLGAVLQYPTLGFTMAIGSNLSDVDPQTILDQAKQIFANDPTFAGLQSATVSQQGPSLVLNLNIKIAGAGSYLPISIVLQ